MSGYSEIKTMQRMMMKSKLHRATVTGADLEYEGSVTLDPHLMDAADILHNERVEIYDITNGNRFATYAIPGHPGAGEVCLNGAAAHQVTTWRPRHHLYLRRLSRYRSTQSHSEGRICRR